MHKDSMCSISTDSSIKSLTEYKIWVDELLEDLKFNTAVSHR